MKLSHFFLAYCISLTVFCSQILQQQDLALTIYNNNFGMVKDTRQIEFDFGQSSLYFTDVASTIQTQTVMFTPKDTKSGIQIYEQNYQNNLANKNSILKKYLGENVSIDVVQGQSARNVRGTLLSYTSGYIMQTPGGISIYDSASGVHLRSLPQGLLTKPTLVWKVFSPKQVSTPCEVAYRATGFSWKADYLLTLNQNEDKTNFAGWVTIDNNSGKKYKDASLKLIAGDVNTVRTTPVLRTKLLMTSAVRKAAAPAPASFSQKSFADYHMYTLSRKVTLNQSSKKQIQFIPTAYNVSIEKFYKLSINAGGSNQNNIPAKSTIKFLNSKSNGLGIALPKGTIRVFKNDPSDNSLEFIGEDSINHTPKDENITVTIGNAFDIVAKTITKDRLSVSNGFDSKSVLQVTNRGDKPARIVAEMNNYYGDNNLISQSQGGNKWIKESATKYTANFTVPVNQTQTVVWEQSYRS